MLPSPSFHDDTRYNACTRAGPNAPAQTLDTFRHCSSSPSGRFGGGGRGELATPLTGRGCPVPTRRRLVHLLLHLIINSEHIVHLSDIHSTSGGTHHASGVIALRQGTTVLIVMSSSPLGLPVISYLHPTQITPPS